jgi:hypothetical protein
VSTPNHETIIIQAMTDTSLVRWILAIFGRDLGIRLKDSESSNVVDSGRTEP